jgi:starvation-inducible DNA-binding protein
MMEELVNLLRKTLADTFTLYLKAHYYHWNVEGKDFPQYHEFLNNLYEDIYRSVDTFAEHIRALGAYSPGSLEEFKAITTITENSTMPMSAESMFSDLDTQLAQYYATLLPVMRISELFAEFGIANYVQDRMATIRKHQWMVRSILKD